MAKLDDTSMMILSGAAARSGLKAFPLPDGLRADDMRVKKVLNKLVSTGLLAGVGATRDDVAWAEDEEGGRTTLVVTPSGLRAINIVPEGETDDAAVRTSTSAAAAKTPASKTKAARPTMALATKKASSKAAATKTKAAQKAPTKVKKPATGAHKRPTSAKSGKGGVKAAKKAALPRTAAKGLTKQQLVVGMLRRANGASIEELAKATNWLPHSVRGVLTATVKGRLGLPLVSEKGEDGVRRYFIAPIRTDKGKD